jgi:menaquinone-9 beta-reductase
MFEDYPRALLLTPSRWHRGAFTGPGAYRAA